MNLEMHYMNVKVYEKNQHIYSFNVHITLHKYNLLSHNAMTIPFVTGVFVFLIPKVVFSLYVES